MFVNIGPSVWVFERTEHLKKAHEQTDFEVQLEVHATLAQIASKMNVSWKSEQEDRVCATYMQVRS